MSNLSDETQTAPRPERAHALSSGKSSVSLAWARVSASLATPTALLFFVPLLVLALGLALTIVGQATLRKASYNLTHERFQSETRATALLLEQAFEQADPMMSELGRHLRDAPRPWPDVWLAPLLRDLLIARSGISQIYIGQPDGAFQGVYFDPSGEIRYQSQGALTNSGKLEQFRFSDRGLVPVPPRELLRFDPRQRKWFDDAAHGREPIWTEPYEFLMEQHMGVTRALPLMARKTGSVVGVLGVDFDVQALSSSVSRAERPDQHVLVFTRQGDVLAYPRLLESLRRGEKLKQHNRLAQLPAASAQDTDSNQAPLQSSEAVRRYAARDPLLKGFFKAVFAPARLGAHSPLRFDVLGEPMLAVTAKVDGTVPDGLFVATLTSEKSFLGEVRAYRRSSMLIAGIALTVAIVVAAWFARNFIKVRRAAEWVREELQSAEERARKLGSYQLLRLLGKGGMGEVWMARHRLLARDAAIKIIHPELTSGEKAEELRARFQREAQVIAALRSRNTVEIYDYGTTADQRLCYVMELLDGIDLETLVNCHGPQAPGRVISCLLQACSSLAEAHDVGLVHRDIKPANLFLCRAADELDILKVLDFGLALREHSRAEVVSELRPSSPSLAHLKEMDGRLTSLDVFVGTPAYMAPEQVIGSPVDARTDLYALGGVAYFLLTGKEAFAGQSGTSLLLAQIKETPPDIRQRVPQPLPPGLAELVSACLEKEPEKRPSSAREVARLLRDIQQHAEPWTAQQQSAFWSERPCTCRDLSPSVLEGRLLGVTDISKFPGEDAPTQSIPGDWIEKRLRSESPAESERT